MTIDRILFQLGSNKFLKNPSYQILPLKYLNMSSDTKSSSSKALQFTIKAECPVTKARTSLMKLPHYEVELPMFMPVGTQGTMKGLTPEQVKDAGAQIILGNTYHLGTRPGKDLLDQHDGLHNFMQWDRALLTDSGGFQMVSLLKLAEITEEGVKFQSPYDGSESMLTPEESIHIQNSIGADIMMQLDDVVDVRVTDYERFDMAVDRTTRWLDRCLKANLNPATQNLFPIIQGGLFPDLRKRSLEQLIARDAPGYAIGGLSGGEEKEKFWPTVHLCTDHLPKNKPRYCMGVGFPVDLVVCCALGVDMFDCVYPTRTARFGCALVNGTQISLKNQDYKFDFTPIDPDCDCFTCQNYTKAYIRSVVNKETIACHLISIHNIAYLMRLMREIRQSIKEGRFVAFVRDFMNVVYKDGDVPKWVTDALNAVNLSLDQKKKKSAKDDASDWDEEESPDLYLERVSGFRNINFNTGYRHSVLQEYEEAAEKGRVLGYKAAMRSVSPIKDSKPKEKLNPSYGLSEWRGVLLACLSLRQNELSSEQVSKIEGLTKNIEALLQRIYVPDEDVVKEICSSAVEASESLDSCQLKVDKFVTKYEEESRQCIRECKQLCDSLSWKVPTHLCS